MNIIQTHKRKLIGLGVVGGMFLSPFPLTHDMIEANS